MTIQAELIRPARAPEDDGAKRRQILDGATAVFLEKGFDAASMGEIARAAGVSKGTLYVYFDDKQALFDAMCRRRVTSTPNACSSSIMPSATLRLCWRNSGLRLPR